MLLSLDIKNFAIVSELTIDWHQGMSAITGETGAGKSIAIDALSLCLGERAEPGAVRAGCDKAELSAIFSVAKLPKAQQWLRDHGLLAELAEECLMRRVLMDNGRTRCYINGSPVPVAQLKELGQLLVSIHGQHAHLMLLKADYQRNLLDDFACNISARQQLKEVYSQWQKHQCEYHELLELQKQRVAKQQLLQYQVEELDEFAADNTEFAELEQEHHRLSHGQDVVIGCQQQLAALVDADEHSLLPALKSVTHQLRDLCRIDNRLSAISDCVHEAIIQLEESTRDLRQFTDSYDIDPERLQEVDNRMRGYFSLARKHHVAPDQLATLHQQLADELAAIGKDDRRLAELSELIAQAKQQYLAQARVLSAVRVEAASQLQQAIIGNLSQLGMQSTRFEIAVNFNEQMLLSPSGLDCVEFLVSTNPGQPLAALAKVASGGELSRIGLAIQVITADKVATPTLIFDEVDVGISGPTAHKVGKLLRQLGVATQVLCVTHLPQVASQAHNQYFVEKRISKDQTFTNMQLLDEEGRILEISRLLGGDSLGEATMANARELLAQTSF